MFSWIFFRFSEIVVEIFKFQTQFKISWVISETDLHVRYCKRNLNCCTLSTTPKTQAKTQPKRHLHDYNVYIGCYKASKRTHASNKWLLIRSLNIEGHSRVGGFTTVDNDLHVPTIWNTERCCCFKEWPQESEVMLLVFNPCLPLWSQGFHVREEETTHVLLQRRTALSLNLVRSNSDITYSFRTVRVSHRFEKSFENNFRNQDSEDSSSIGRLSPRGTPTNPYPRGTPTNSYTDVVPLFGSSETLTTTVTTWLSMQSSLVKKTFRGGPESSWISIKYSRCVELRSIFTTKRSPFDNCFTNRYTPALPSFRSSVRPHLLTNVVWSIVSDMFPLLRPQNCSAKLLTRIRHTWSHVSTTRRELRRWSMTRAEEYFFS